MCNAPVRGVTTLYGAVGSSPPQDAAAAGNIALFTSGSCAAGFATFLPGPRAVYALFLGANATLGGILTLSTCGLTTNDTVLYVGTGCPTWFGSFNCLRGNDNAGDVAGQACGANGLASTLRHVTASRVYFVMVGGWGGAAGRLVTGLSWSYAPPRGSASAGATPTRTATTTATRSRSAKATVTRTRSALVSASRSRKAKP